jgi:hypothetical protein
LPPEFCEFNSKKVFNKCKPWLIKNLPDLYPYLKGTWHCFALGVSFLPFGPLTTRASTSRRAQRRRRKKVGS